MDDHREWEKARQVVKAIQQIMVGGGEEEPTPENPVVVTSSMTGSGAVKTETTVKKILNVEYDKRVEELGKEKIKVDAEGAAAIERLKAKWSSPGK
jgi:hypothetical protein